jgi:hypothetical protein
VPVAYFNIVENGGLVALISQVRVVMMAYYTGEAQHIKWQRIARIEARVVDTARRGSCKDKKVG